MTFKTPSDAVQALDTNVDRYYQDTVDHPTFRTTNRQIWRAIEAEPPAFKDAVLTLLRNTN